MIAMKIAIVLSNFYPEMFGGMEWYAYHMAKGLVKKGAEVRVFTQRTKKAFKKEEEIDGIKISRLKSIGLPHRLRYWFGLGKKLREFKPDLIHTMDYSQSHSWLALRFGKKHKIPVCLTINDIVSMKKPRPRLKQFLLQLFDDYFASFFLKKADKLLLRTAWTKEWILSKGVKEERIAITPSGLSEEELSKGNALRFVEKFGITGPIILYLGIIKEQKGAKLLLDSFASVKQEIPNAKLVFVGAEEIAHERMNIMPDLRKKINEKNLNDVYFLGPLYGKDKIDALAACTVMALPSSFENFGQAYSQAMAQGKPVVGTTGGGIPEIIDDNLDGFTIQPWNEQMLTEKILLLLRDAELREAMGAAGEKKVQQYKYEKLVNELIGIYQNVLHRKIRIAQVCPFVYPVIGGMEEHVLQMSEELVRRGYDVTILTSNLEGKRKIKNKRELINGIKVERFNAWFRIGEFASFWPGFLWKLLKEKYDIIQAHSYRHPHAWLSLIAKIRGSKIIYSTHSSFIPRELKPLWIKVLYYLYDLIIAPLTLPLYDKVILLTPDGKGNFLRMGVKEKNLVVQPNGVPLESFDKINRNQFRKKQGIKGKMVLFLGQLYKLKGPQFLIECIPKINSNATFVFVGPDFRGYKKELDLMIKNLGVSDKVKFIGKLTGKEKIAAYAACDLFVMPSMSESFGIVLLEAMAQGKAIVAAKSPGPNYLIKEGVNGFLVDYGNVAAMSEKIDNLLSNKALAEKIGTHNRAKARQFTWDKVINTTEEIYTLE